MHSEATLSLYSMVNRIAKLCSKDVSCDGDKSGIMPVFALLFKKAGGRVRMTDISEYLMITKPAATQAVNKLVEKGMVERVSDAHDRRVVYIQPTETGKNIFEQEIENRMAFVDRVVERMGEADAKRLVALLDRFLIEAAAEAEEI